MINNILSINIDKNNQVEGEGIDFSTMNAISSCPFRGIVRNVLGKQFKEGEERNMALEAGDLSHKVYAVWRAMSIKDEELRDIYVKKFLKQVVPEMPDEIFEKELEELVSKTTDCITPLSKMMVYADWIIANSGFYDDEKDKKRTIENIRTSLMAYGSNFLTLVAEEPVWISEDRTKVGIELPFEHTIRFEYKENSVKKVKYVKFIGKIDGIHVHKNGKLIIHENKTAARLDDSWLAQWFMSHQITGYCLAASDFVGEFIDQARVLGMQIPVPKSSGYAYRTERVDRPQHFLENWAKWVIVQADIIEQYKDCPEKAIMNTKSCCAFYSTCPLMCLCTLPEDERKQAINEMVVKKWSPLNE